MQYCALCTLVCIIAPDWAAVNLGVYVCIDCASIHKRLGSSTSGIKSIIFDQWTAEMAEVSVAKVGSVFRLCHVPQSMLSMGNKKAKDEWEAKVPNVWLKPTPNSRLLVTNKIS